MVEEPSNIQFPWKLHTLLDEAHREGYNHIISWLPTGNAFKVHDKIEFAELIMPKYFHSNKYKSFQRNLNLWCFQTLTKEPNKGAIFHPYFLRCNPDRCHLMKRIKVKKNSERLSLAQLRASAPPVVTALPTPSSLSKDPKVTLSAPTQTSALNVAQLVYLTQRQNEQRRQLQQIQRLAHCQDLLQRVAIPAQSHLDSLVNKLSHQRQTTKPTSLPSPSALNSLVLRQMAQKQAPHPQNTSLSDVDRLNMHLSLALLIANPSSACTNTMGTSGILRNEATSSK